jgi:hypothetical protein
MHLNVSDYGIISKYLIQTNHNRAILEATRICLLDESCCLASLGQDLRVNLDLVFLNRKIIIFLNNLDSEKFSISFYLDSILDIVLLDDHRPLFF